VNAAATAGAVAAVAAAFTIGRETAPTPGVPPTTRFGIAAASAGWFDPVSVSPDGRYIVYTGGLRSDRGASVNSYFTSAGGFWLRAIDSVESQRLPETEQANPIFFWSPDSHTLGYAIGDVIVVRDVPSGAPRRITQIPGRVLGVTWSTKGEFVATTGDALYRVPATGGTPRLFLKTDLARERWRAAPSFLPDGERLLYTTLEGESEGQLQTRAATLDGRELGVVATGAIGTIYADGHVVFGSHGALYAQQFDTARLRLVGERVEISPAVAQDWRTGSLGASVSNAGVMAFRSAVEAKFQFTFVDRNGNRQATIGNADDYLNFDISPDGRRIVASRRDPLTSRMSLWLIDIERGITSLISDPNDSEDADDPTWTPDGQHIAYRHGSRLVMRLANGGEERTLVNVEAYPDSFTHDGRYVTYGAAASNKGDLYEQWVLDILTPGSRPMPIVTGVTMSDESKFSPSGRWIAYHSNETGVDQVYVVPFPLTGEKWQVSETGGVQPRWSRDGAELFYLTADGKLMAVSIPDSDPRRAAPPKELFATQLAVSDAFDQFAVRGDRFVIREPMSTATNPTTVQVVVNWKSGSR
jgi:Tol biopolymer transport system component